MINQDKTEALLTTVYFPFESTEKSLRDMFKGWGWRGLTIIGKMQVMKCFALTKVLYRLTMISNKKKRIHKENKHLTLFFCLER